MNHWIQPIPTEYGGTLYRSRLEATWASTLDGFGIEFEYETVRLDLGFGVTYLPDLILRELKTVIEVKGAHMKRAEKTMVLASQLASDDAAEDWIVIFGWAPAPCGEPGRPPYFMRWSDAHGGNSLFVTCRHCGASQWSRPRISIACRKCGERMGDGHHFARSGDEIPFGRSRDVTFASPAFLWKGEDC